MDQFLPEHFWGAFWLCLLASLATGVGSCIAFFCKTTNRKLLSVALGFSAGMMIYVSFVEIFQMAQVSLVAGYGLKQGTILTVLGFFGGMGIIALIDKFVPEVENPHEIKDYSHTHLTGEEQKGLSGLQQKKLMRTGLFMAFALGLHNFPEGLVTFLTALQDPKVGVSICIAIAIHNIPEGISVSVPIFYATGSKKKAFVYSFLSGFAEPIGALLGYFLVIQFIPQESFGIVSAAMAGIMVFVCLDELLPAAREYGEHHLSIYGMMIGMVVMAGSLLLFL
jgi:ZIP family zinc transporter